MKLPQNHWKAKTPSGDDQRGLKKFVILKMVVILWTVLLVQAVIQVNF